MWAQYRKTFWPMQAMILAVTLAVYFGFDRFFARAMVFWVIMQMGALIGAVWAARIKSYVRGNESRLPLEKRG